MDLIPFTPPTCDLLSQGGLSDPTAIMGDILVVDDRVDNIVLLAELLEGQGYTVRKALSGPLALQAAIANPPDLILLDICMPDMDGYEVCRLLKQHPDTAQVPVIFLSALDELENKITAFEAGGVDYITKPFQCIEVLARTRTHLSLRSAIQTVESLNQALEAKVRLRTQQLEQANSQLMKLAYHDPLTQLPNRAFLADRLNHALAATRLNPDYSFALLFLDCDRFKLVNDSFGHGAGDDLLVAIAQRLSRCLAPQDTLARFGGDEFVVLLDRQGNREAVLAIAQALLDVFSQSFQLPQGEVFISASIGIVFNDGHQHYLPEHILRDADTAMYQAKAQGKAQFCVFTPAMQRASARVFQIETELHQGLQRGEIIPYYQPIVRLQGSDRAWVGAEVLCRWHHPQRGILSPSTFIPIAEETHLIVELDSHLLERACAQLQQWQCQELVDDSFYLSLNLSARHLMQPLLPEQVQDCLQRYRLRPHHLRLEITEGCILDNNRAKVVMEQLSSQGIQLSVDDFGTGYSSLSYLHQLPVSTLKIDRAFIQDMNRTERDRGIVMAILGIAKALNLRVIAEGLETPDHAYALQSLHCDFGQGYLFAPPRPGEQFLSQAVRPLPKIPQVSPLPR